MASMRQSPFEKRLNSQAKYLIKRLWDFFEQQAMKSTVSVNLKRKISNAIGIKGLAYAQRIVF